MNTRTREWLAPVLTGLLLVLSYPPVSVVAAAFVALVPLLLYIVRRPPGRAGRWAAARAGFLAGLVYFGLLLYWIAAALMFSSPLAVPVYALTVMLLAGIVGAVAFAIHYTRERLPRVPLALTAAVFWTGFEWFKAHLGPLSFPWLGLGTALGAVPRLAGAADLVGARGLTFWLALVNGLVATAILRYRAGRSLRRTVVLTAIVIALPIGYGVWRAETLELRPAGRIAVVQPNLTDRPELGREAAIAASMGALTRLTRRIPPGSVDLVVWPEVAVPAVLSRPDRRGLRARIRQLSARVGAPIIAGAYGAERAGGERLLYNSAYRITPSGTVREVYRKRHLVPFVERVPFIDPDWVNLGIGDPRYYGALGRGTEVRALGARVGSEFGILICFESTFGSLARRFRLDGADYLLNITNDAWFGGKPWWARTSALWQHPAHLPLRAIETRVGVVRAANTGFSLFVDPIGRVYEATELFQPAVRVATVYTTEELTLYARWGDWLATGAAGVALVLLLAARFGVRMTGAEFPRGAPP